MVADKDNYKLMYICIIGNYKISDGYGEFWELGRLTQAKQFKSMFQKGRQGTFLATFHR